MRNNVEGYEADVLRRFEEPAWNNPVVRFLGADGRDVLARKDGVWSAGALLGRMTAALRAARRPVPAWLATVAAETASGEVATAVFAMS
jgi:hypothetical protein